MQPRPKTLRLILLIGCLPMFGFGSLAQLLAPDKEPWPRWEAQSAQSNLQVDHRPWDELLRRYRHLDNSTAAGANNQGQNVAIARFDYAALSNNPGDLAQLQRYLDSLAAVPVSQLRRDRQLAYWINLYNALTIATVTAHWPVASIRDIDISPGLFADGPWGAPLVEVEGIDLSLNDIEHRIVRPIWDDPRIHYALNCAALGCPDLAAQAWRGASMEEMLDAAARRYVNSARALSLSNDGVEVSSIYIWFQDDFGGSDASVLGHLRRYADAATQTRLARQSRISDHHYDWRLNSVAR